MTGAVPEQQHPSCIVGWLQPIWRYWQAAEGRSQQPGLSISQLQRQRAGAAPAPRCITRGDLQLCAGLLLGMLLACWVAVGADHGLAPRPLTTRATLAGRGSLSYDTVRVRSSLVGVDAAAEQLLLEFVVDHGGPEAPQHCGAARGGRLLHLAVGTGTPAAAAPAALLPLCPAAVTTATTSSSIVAGVATSAQDGGGGVLRGAAVARQLLPGGGAVYVVALPLRHKADSLPAPFEELVADVRLSLRAAGAGAAAAPTPRRGQRQQPDSAGASPPAATACSSTSASSSGGGGSGGDLPGDSSCADDDVARSVPLVEWTALWASPDVQLAVRRGRQQPGAAAAGGAGLLATALTAGGSGDVDGEERSAALLQQLGLSGQQQQPGRPEATVTLLVSRSAWVRVIGLTTALLQATAIVWCCLLVTGQVVCAYVLHRFLCGTRHHLHGGLWR